MQETGGRFHPCCRGADWIARPYGPAYWCEAHHDGQRALLGGGGVPGRGPAGGLDRRRTPACSTAPTRCPQPTTLNTGSAAASGSILWLLSIGVSRYANPRPEACSSPTPTPRPWPIPIQLGRAQRPVSGGPHPGADQRGGHAREHPRRSVPLSRPGGAGRRRRAVRRRPRHPRPGQRQLLLPALPGDGRQPGHRGPAHVGFRRDAARRPAQRPRRGGHARHLPRRRARHPVVARRLGRRDGSPDDAPAKASSCSPPPSPARSRRSRPRSATAPSPMPCWRGCAAAPTPTATACLSVSELFGYVARRVPALTQGQQHPYNKMEGTDFTLLRVAAGGAMPTPTAAAAAAPTESGPPRRQRHRRHGVPEPAPGRRLRLDQQGAAAGVQHRAEQGAGAARVLPRAHRPHRAGARHRPAVSPRASSASAAC